MRLWHGRFCAIQDVIHQKTAERQRFGFTIYVAGFFLVNDIQMVAAFVTRNVHIFANFDVALRTELVAAFVDSLMNLRLLNSILIV